MAAPLLRVWIPKRKSIDSAKQLEALSEEGVLRFRQACRIHGWQDNSDGRATRWKGAWTTAGQLKVTTEAHAFRSQALPLRCGGARQAEITGT
jgi:hypothetical protein